MSRPRPGLVLPQDLKPVIDGMDGIKISQGLGLQDFDLIRVIGRGSYAKVLLVRLKKSDQVYAMKVVKKELVHDDEVSAAPARSRRGRRPPRNCCFATWGGRPRGSPVAQRVEGLARVCSLARARPPRPAATGSLPGLPVLGARTGTRDQGPCIARRRLLGARSSMSCHPSSLQ